MPIRKARGWFIGSGAVISRIWSSRMLWPDVARMTPPAHIDKKKWQMQHEHDARADKPVERRRIQRVGLDSMSRVDGGGDSMGRVVSEPWIDPDDDAVVVHGVLQDIVGVTLQQREVLDFEHHVLPTMTGTRDKHYSAAGSHEHDEQWTEHITSKGQLLRLGQAKPMGEQPRSWASEAMHARPFNSVSKGAVALACQTMRPSKILLVRHGECESTKSYKVMAEMPDWKVPLTELGITQAQFSGRRLKDIIGNLDVYMYHSPYTRTRQSVDHIQRALDPEQVKAVLQEPRIAEQQFGNLSTVEDIIRCKQERDEFGRFFYRFPHGEAGLDVYNRVTGFIETVRRRHYDNPNCCIVIVTHGLSLRLFLMRWFQWTVEQFESTITPPYGGIAVMNISPDRERYTLTPQTLHMIGASNAPATTAIGRSMLRKAYVNAFLSY